MLTTTIIDNSFTTGVSGGAITGSAGSLYSILGIAVFPQPPSGSKITKIRVRINAAAATAKLCITDVNGVIQFASPAIAPSGGIFEWDCSVVPTGPYRIGIGNFSGGAISYSTPGAGCPYGSGVWISNKSVSIAPGSTITATYANSPSYTLMTEITLMQSYATLIQVGQDIMSWESGAWKKAGMAPATEAMFDTHGMPDITVLNSTVMAQLQPGSTSLLIEALNDATPSFMRATAAPIVGKLILPNDDIPLGSFECINSVALTSVVSGNGNLRLAVSVDSGKTWRTWLAGGWNALDIANIATQGFIPSDLNARTKSDWTTIIGDSATLRFAYWLDIQTSSDLAQTDSISLNVDMRGRWKQAKDADCDVYLTNTTAEVYLLNNGNYKINY